ncbi:hypothetical protein [Terrabacter sp. NPDC000476]|uniref:hypothetical protein n=1 Tax=Terrabacter sp. NPDC000476 TaxID=3154258 RepID=UPI00332307A4
MARLAPCRPATGMVRFVDEQQRDPFTTWWHEPTFAAEGAGVTLMTDTITYAAPLGPLGRLAERAVLDTYLPRLVGERNEWLRRDLAHRPRKDAG